MESFNELCLKWWQGFYSSFQSSCTMTCISEQGALSMKQGEMSILLGVGGSETSDLLGSCEIPDIDVIKFNQVLCQMETLCMPKIILMYEQYKSSLHLESKEGGLVVDTFQLTDDGLHHNNTLRSDVSVRAEPKIEHLEIISAGEDFCFKPEAPEMPSMMNNSLHSNSGMLVASSSANENVKGENDETNDTQTKNADESTSLDSNLEGGKNRLLELNTEKESAVIVDPSAALMKTEQEVFDVTPVQPEENQLVEDEIFEAKMSSGEFRSPIRRSTREVRVSSKFAENREVIRRLIKPQSHEISGSDSQDNFPIICSTCQAVFADPVSLRTHWKSHKQNKARKKCLAFYCLQCKLSFPNHQRVKLHHCSKRNLNPETKKVGLSAGSVSTDTPLELTDKLLASKGAHKEAESRAKGDAEKSCGDGTHACDVCSLRFPTAKLLHTHFKIHGKNPYKCGECEKQFRQKRTLVLHNSLEHTDTNLLQNEHSPKAQVDVHLGKKTFFCEVCGKGFHRQQSWHNHRKLHERKEEFQCLQCQKSFLDKRSLEAHHSVHTGEKPHVCEVCGKRFRIARGLINHSRIHDKSLHYKCEQCPKTFIEKRSLEAHKLSHSGLKPFSCGICGKTFRRELGLINHARLHDQSKAIRCDVCNKSFVDKWGMLKHKSIHTGEKPFTCDVCGKSFRIKKGLLDHAKLHNKDLQLKCHLCPRTFVEKRKLDIHLRAHQGEKAYVCDQCGQRFMNSMTLKVHKRRHTGEKPYKCSFCDKAFNQQGTLIAHERYHKGERPYVCEVCGDGYITKSHLTIHRRKHSNDRPYKCDQCDYAAFTHSLLRIHMLKHSSEKPFKCQVCPAAFKRTHHLEVHMRTHNSTEKIFQCQYCDEAFDSNKKYSVHLSSHEIVVVTPHPGAPDEIFTMQGPGEVAYDMVLLS